MGHEVNDTHQNLFLHNRLDTVGDGTGVKNAIGDYSVVPQLFKIQPGPGRIFRLARMTVVVSDGAGVISWGDYGPMSALVNGVTFALDLRNIPADVTFDPIVIRSNMDWSKHTFDTQIKVSPAQNFFQAAWDFSLSGQVQRLDGNEGEYFGLVLNDDFTSLNTHVFTVDGEIENTARK